MAERQVRWLLERGGMGAASAHCAQASSLIYDWAQAHLRTRGIVDIGAYRGVGVNQLRIGTWPSVEVDDVEALLTCIDYCLERVL